METEKHEGLERVVEGEAGDQSLPDTSRENILAKIEELEKAGDYFDAASLAREQGYTDRALENYKAAAEKYRGFVVSKKSLLGKNLSYPKRHKVKIGDYIAEVRFSHFNIYTTGLGDQMVPFGRVKIKAPGLKVETYFAQVLNFIGIAATLKRDIISKYVREVNDNFLEEILREALRPYQVRDF